MYVYIFHMDSKMVDIFRNFQISSTRDCVRFGRDRINLFWHLDVDNSLIIR